MVHLNILDKNREKLLKELSFTAEIDLYLAGGTALGFHLGHRTSMDFDFYRKESFKEGEFTRIFENNLQEWNMKYIRNQQDTFQVRLDGIELSCFYYPYPLINDTLTAEGIVLASIEDIAAMKLIAIVQRGTYRDFVDMYYLLKEMGLEKIINLTAKKYKTFDPYSGLRALIYFEDADKGVTDDRKRIEVYDKDLSWDKIKNYITDKVKVYQQKYLNSE